MNGKINGVQEILYDSCLTFQISSFFFPFISLLKTTREAEVVTVLPRFWFERDELQCTQQTVTYETSARIARNVLLLEPGENKKKMKFVRSCANPIPNCGIFFFHYFSKRLYIYKKMFNHFPVLFIELGEKKPLKL